MERQDFRERFLEGRFQIGDRRIVRIDLIADSGVIGRVLDHEFAHDADAHAGQALLLGKTGVGFLRDQRLGQRGINIAGVVVAALWIPQGVEDDRCVFDRAAVNPGSIDKRVGADTAAERDDRFTGIQVGETVVSRGNAAGAAGLFANRAGDQIGCHRHT